MKIARTPWYGFVMLCRGPKTLNIRSDVTARSTSGRSPATCTYRSAAYFVTP